VVRSPETCRGRRAWHAKKEPYGNWEALPPPDAPTAGGQSGQEVQRQEDLPTGVAIYETDFLDCSYGYRPGRNPLQAVRALTDALQRGQFEFIVEAHFEL